MTSLRTMAFEACDNSVLVLVHGLMAPSDEDWSQWVDVVERMRQDGSLEGMLVVSTQGTGPNVRQRKTINDSVGSRPYRVVVMSNHRTTRAIVTAFSWFNSGMKSCGEGDYTGAVAHLGLGPEWVERLASTVGKLERHFLVDAGAEHV